MDTPENKKQAGFGDWHAKLRSGNPNWESELTPEEVIAMETEMNWASDAVVYDWPGPRRIGVMF